MEYGTLKSISDGKNEDGTRDVHLLEVDILDDDPVTVELDASTNEDYLPRIGARVYFEEVTETYLVATRIQDEEVGIDTDLSSGDRVSYAISETGEKVASIRQKEDGEIILDEGTDYAVLYIEMKAAFDELKADHNALVRVVNNLVLPVNIAALTAGPAAPLVAQTSTVDMRSARSGKIRLK